MPVHRVEPDRCDRIRARSDKARTGTPHHRRGGVHTQHGHRGENDDPDRQRPRRDAVEKAKAAVHGSDRGRFGENPIVLARERIVDQQVALIGHLVGVQEVMTPIRSLGWNGYAMSHDEASANTTMPASTSSVRGSRVRGVARRLVVSYAA